MTNSNENLLRLFNKTQELESVGVLSWGGSYEYEKQFQYILMKDYTYLLNNICSTTLHIKKHDERYYRIERYILPHGKKRLLALATKEELQELMKITHERREEIEHDEKEHIYTFKAE